MEKDRPFRRAALPLFLIGVGLALKLWTRESAAPLERVWVWLAIMSTCVALGTLSSALQVRGWLNDEADRHPDRSYAASRVVSETHVVTHAAMLIVQVAFLQFGAFAAFQRPANPTNPQGLTPVSIELTGTLLAVELVLTGLNIYIAHRRRSLVARVIELGGD